MITEILDRIDQQVLELIPVKSRLDTMMIHEALSRTDEIEFNRVNELLRELERTRRRWVDILSKRKKMKVISKSFREADAEWISEITGIEVKFHRWTSFLSKLDPNVSPSSRLIADFEDFFFYFHLQLEAGRGMIDSLSGNASEEGSEVEYKSFEEADPEWTQLVTGVNCTYRRWIDWKNELDLTIFPSEDFDECYMNIVNAYIDLHSRVSRFSLITMYLRDIIRRPEFMTFLRVFPGFELSAESNDAKKRVLHGKTDFGIGYHRGCDVFKENPPADLRLVVAQSKFRDFEYKDMCYCIAQAAALHKFLKDSGSEDCCVWGVLSDAMHWKFIFIDDSGKLWRSDEHTVQLMFYDKEGILPVYRFLYCLIKRCFESCQKAISPRANSIQ